MLPFIYVDCVEFHSEKLIATYVSLSLDNILRKLARDSGVDFKLQRKLTFKACRNFPMLLDALQELNEQIAILRKEGEIKKFGLEGVDFFFYLVLDNATNILSQERTKKTITKLCVAQSLSTPMCFGLILIDAKLHGSALDGDDVFRDLMPLLYEEYMFTPFILSPMNEQQLKSIIKESLVKLIRKRVMMENTVELFEHELRILERVFEGLFLFL